MSVSSLVKNLGCCGVLVWLLVAAGQFKGTIFFLLFMYVIQHSFICRPSDSTVSEGMLGLNPGLL
jgi:hypothetical protein